ncbi:MAG: MFS transporter [Gammaproteobacteria bacterium]|nr:MFS transporter [Gammaproteobacteria bacterium]
MLIRRDSVPYWRLSGFYLFYFAGLGVVMPYWSLYLQSLGFGPAAIGELVAMMMVTRIVAPYLWGWIADRRGLRMSIVRFASFLTMVSFAGIFIGQSYWQLIFITCLFSFFKNASLPQFEAATLSHLGERTHSYSRIRVWGSIGFIATVVGVGYLLEHQPVALVPVLVLIFFAGLWLMSLSVPERAVTHQPHPHGSIYTVLRRPSVMALLAVCFLMQLSHCPYYTFYTIYLESYAYTRGTIGLLWALGVAAEVLIFFWMHRLLARFKLRDLLLASLFVSGVRWLLIGYFVEFPSILLGAQLLHAASFAVYHAVAIQLFHEHFTGRHQGRGQALYSSVSFGAGASLGTLLSGYTWDAAGAQASYTWAAAACALAYWITRRFINH